MSGNKGKPWTQEEVTSLLSELSNGMLVENIAEVHGRTVNAIKFKAYGFACDYVLKEGKSVEEVALELGIDKDELDNELNRRKVQPKAPKAPKAPNAPNAPKAPKAELNEILSAVNRVQSLLSNYINSMDN